MKTHKKSFGLDIRLGLALIVLVLLVLLFATNYTIYRVKNTMKSKLTEELHSAAIVSFNRLANIDEAVWPDSIINNIKYDFDLKSLAILPLDFARATTIQMDYPLDKQLISISGGLKANELRPLLKNEYIFRHNLGEETGLLLYPVELSGSKFILAMEKESALLSSVEKAGSLLVYCAILGTLIIIYASVKFARRVISPFESLKEKAAASGHLSDYANDEVEQLINSYETIINNLKTNELELAKLNSIVSEKAEHLEVYNNYILNSINTGIITLDIERKISTVNPAVYKICKFEQINNDDNSYAKIMRPYPALLDFVDKFFITEDQIENEKIEIISGDSAKIISASISPLYDKDNRKIGYLLILLDQTDFINLERELEIRERMAVLGEMSGGLAHQLRNSIGGMIGFARLIEKKNNNEQARKNIAALLKETSEAENLVSRFLDFARPLEPQTTSINIRDMIDYLIDSLSGQFPNIELRAEYDENLNEIEVDTLLLKQALSNLIINGINSIKHDRGRVTVSSDTSDGNLRITIADNGSGIPEKYRDKIFTPFFSGNPSGTGLGLPLVRKIILLHDGRIEFESDENGTRFIITLPVLSARQNRSLKHSVSSLP
ncbi:MAG: ATP-binding protein [Candidatus Zixiibacteriota bacterium]